MRRPFSFTVTPDPALIYKPGDGLGTLPVGLSDIARANGGVDLLTDLTVLTGRTSCPPLTLLLFSALPEGSDTYLTVFEATKYHLSLDGAAIAEWHNLSVPLYGTGQSVYLVVKLGRVQPTRLSDPILIRLVTEGARRD